MGRRGSNVVASNYGKQKGSETTDDIIHAPGGWKVQECTGHLSTCHDDGTLPGGTGMTSGADSSHSASQPERRRARNRWWEQAVREYSSGVASTGRASQAATGAPLVEDRQEPQRARHGEWHTIEVFKEYYRLEVVLARSPRKS